MGPAQCLRVGPQLGERLDAKPKLIFGPPGVGKSHLAIGLGRKVVEQGHTVRFTTATALLSVLGKAESEGNLGDKLIEYSKPRLLIIDELGYLPFSNSRPAVFALKTRLF